MTTGVGLGLNRELREHARRVEPLTEKQRRVLRLAALGLTRNEIAARLEVHPETVKTHMRVIREQLDARNTAHAVAIALSIDAI